MRDLTAGIRIELTAATIKQPVFFIEADLRTQMLRLCSVVGLTPWRGYLWNGPSGSGDGAILNIDVITETASLEATGLRFTFSNLPSDLLAACLDEIRVGKKVRLWMGFLNSTGVLIADPIESFSGRLDMAESEESGETSTLIVTVESEMIRLQTPMLRLLTLEDQKIDFPTDTGFQYMDSIKNWKGKWGANQIAASTTGGGTRNNGGDDSGVDQRDLPIWTH